jgi:hypothetical protein
MQCSFNVVLFGIDTLFPNVCKAFGILPGDYSSVPLSALTNFTVTSLVLMNCPFSSYLLIKCKYVGITDGLVVTVEWALFKS